MTFDEALKMCKRIESYAVGSLVKGMRIDSLWIGPTDWNEVTNYLNTQIRKGREGTLLQFAGKSFSVYGVSIDKTYQVPHHTMINLDTFEQIMSN